MVSPQEAQDYFFIDKLGTIDALERNIRLVIADIRPQFLQKVLGNCASSLEFIRATNGDDLLEIIFKT